MYSAGARVGARHASRRSNGKFESAGLFLKIKSLWTRTHTFSKISRACRRPAGPAWSRPRARRRAARFRTHAHVPMRGAADPTPACEAARLEGAGAFEGLAGRNDAGRVGGLPRLEGEGPFVGPIVGVFRRRLEADDRLGEIGERVEGEGPFVGPLLGALGGRTDGPPDGTPREHVEGEGPFVAPLISALGGKADVPRPETGRTLGGEHRWRADEEQPARLERGGPPFVGPKHANNHPPARLESALSGALGGSLGGSLADARPGRLEGERAHLGPSVAGQLMRAPFATRTPAPRPAGRGPPTHTVPASPHFASRPTRLPRPADRRRRPARGGLDRAHAARAPTGGGGGGTRTSTSTKAPPVARAALPRHPTEPTVPGEVELDEVLFAVLVVLALYCFVALRRGGRLRFLRASGARPPTQQGAAGAHGEAGKKTRGATRDQIEHHLAHTTVDLFDREGEKVAVQFEQEACAICLDSLRRRAEGAGGGVEGNAVRILRCKHAFHAGEFRSFLFESVVLFGWFLFGGLTSSSFGSVSGVACIDAWLLRCNQCPCCLKQPW